MAIIEAGGKSWHIPDSGSPCDQWRVYYSQLKKAVGKENARMIWLLTWKENGSSGCTTNADFNKWLQKNKIDVSNASTRAIADVSQIGENVLGLGKGLTKVLAIGVPITLSLILILILYFLFKNANNPQLLKAVAMKKGGKL